jgi:phosphomethylpyrimidine synthase
MKISEDVRKYAAKQDAHDEAGRVTDSGEKSKEFVEQGAEVYAQA